MLLRARRLLTLLLLLALPLKGVAGLLMVGCVGMAWPDLATKDTAATSMHAASAVPPCHEATDGAAVASAPTTAGCCHCGPCLAPMAGFEPPVVMAAVPTANPAPEGTAALRAGRSAEPPQPPPRS